MDLGVTGFIGGGGRCSSVPVASSASGFTSYTVAKVCTDSAVMR